MNNIIKKDRIDQKIEEIVRESVYAWLKANNEILYNLSENDYNEKYESIKNNFEKAKEFLISEDWIYKNTIIYHYIYRSNIFHVRKNWI